MSFQNIRGELGCRRKISGNRLNERSAMLCQASAIGVSQNYK